MNDGFVNTSRSYKGQMREDQKKGSLRFSMYSLIGDRFLKQFFGSRLHLHRVDLASEAGSPMESEGDKSTEPGYSPGEDPLKNEAMLENKKTGEIKEPVSPDNGSVQPTTDDYPLTADGCR
jgi:hypothetical protein